MKSILTGIFLICSALCFAQSDSVEVQVKVFDYCDSTSTIAGATVHFFGQSNEITCVTGPEGYFFVRLKRGIYSIETRSIGYHNLCMVGFPIKGGKNMIIKMPLIVKCQ